MSFTSTSSSWFASNVVSSTASGSATESPANISAYALATRAGVRLSPSRSGSSPIAISSSRTAASARARSTPGAGSLTGVIRSRRLYPLGVVRVAGGRRRHRWQGPSGLLAVRRGLLPRRIAVRVTRPVRLRRAIALARSGLVGGRCLARLPDRGAALDQTVRPCAGRDLDRRAIARRALAKPGERVVRRPLAYRCQDALEVFLVQRLLLDQFQHHLVEGVPVLDEDLPGFVVRRLDQIAHLGVDVGGDVLGVVALVGVVAAEERLGLVHPVLHGAELGTHAVLGDHGAGELRRLLDVVGRTGGRLVEDELFGRPSAQGVHQLVEDLGAGLRVTVLDRQHEGVPERAAARQDRDLVHRVEVGHRPCGQRVARLVVGGDLLFLVAHRAGLALGAGDDPVDGLFQRLVVDQPAAGTRGQQRRLVDHVGQVGTGEAGRAAGDDRQVDVRGEGLPLGVYGKHGLASLDIRRRHRDLPVEPSGTQQRRVEDVRPVGRRDEDYAALDVESVHFDEQLVQRLLALVVAAAEAGAAMPAYRVDFVHEDDRRGVRLGLLEEVAYPGRANADEHLDEVRPGDRVERHSRLTGHRPGEQRLAGTRRAEEQHALRDLGAQRLVAGRVLKEVLDLLQLLDRLVLTGDIGEGRLGGVLADELGLAAAEAHNAVAAALHLAHHEEQHADDQQDRQQADQQRQPRVALGDLGRERPAGVGAGLRGQLVEDRAAGIRRERRADLLLAVDRVLQVDLELLLLVTNRGGGEVAAVDLRVSHRRVDRLVVAAAGDDGRQNEDGENDHDGP